MKFQCIKSLLAAVLILSVIHNTEAYDISIINNQGTTLFFDISSTGNAELTYASDFNIVNPYKGKIDIPSSISIEGRDVKVVSIGEMAFFNCRELVSVNIPDGIESLGMRAFGWCDNLEKITLPASVRNIGANAFDGCFSLEAIDVKGANSWFASLQGVLFDKTKQTLIDYPDDGEINYSLPSGTVSVADYAFMGNNTLSKIILNQELKSIGDNAFYFCNNLADIFIPKSVEYIGSYAFADCFNLESIDVDGDNPYYTSLEGVLLDKNGRILYQSPGASVALAKIPNQVAKIADGAFFRNYGLTTVVLPETTTEIGENAFTECRDITSIQLSSQIKSIGTLAFCNLDTLQSLYVPVTNPDKIKLGTDVFVNTSGHCTLYVPKGTIDKYAKLPQWCDFHAIREYDELTPQTIEWDVANDYVESDHRIRLSAKASSGLPVSYTIAPISKGTAILKGNVIEIVDSAYIAVTATQAGNSRFAPAAPVTRELNPAASVDDIIADIDIAKVYGSHGKIIVKCDKPDITIYVYDISGSMIYRGKDRTIPVGSSGVYIVRIGDHKYKVAVM